MVKNEKECPSQTPVFPFEYETLQILAVITVIPKKEVSSYFEAVCPKIAKYNLWAHACQAIMIFFFLEIVGLSIIQKEDYRFN